MESEKLKFFNFKLLSFNFIKPLQLILAGSSESHVLGEPPQTKQEIGDPEIEKTEQFFQMSVDRYRTTVVIYL